MFENNADFDFDENLEITTIKAPTKRPPSISPVEANKRAKTSPKLPRNVIKRKFPGPAGILPERKDFDFSVPQPPHKNANDETPCSQTSLTAFQTEPWLQMTQDFDTFPENYNIKWIKTKANLNQLPNQKAPFLAAIIHTVDCFNEKNPIVNVVLKDPTGEIQGTIIHSLYEEQSSNLVIGSVIVLRHFGVLTTGLNNNHHLTITRKNLVSVYVKKSEDSDVRTVKLQEISEDGRVKELFDFKQSTVAATCSRLVVDTSAEDTELWQKALEGVDADSFFDEF